MLENQTGAYLLLVLSRSIAGLVEVVRVVKAKVVVVMGSAGGHGGKCVGVAIGCLVHQLVLELSTWRGV